MDSDVTASPLTGGSGPVGEASTRTGPAATAQPGNWIEVAGIGGADARKGEVLAVLGADAHLHLRVRWDDGHESVFYPEAGGFIVHSGERGRR